MHPNAKLRQAILETLYQHRETHAGTLQPKWVSEYELKARHGDVAFALDVLVEAGQVQRDGPHYWITGPGVMACEANLPAP